MEYYSFKRQFKVDQIMIKYIENFIMEILLGSMNPSKTHAVEIALKKLEIPEFEYNICVL